MLSTLKPSRIINTFWLACFLAALNVIFPLLHSPLLYISVLSAHVWAPSPLATSFCFLSLSIARDIAFLPVFPYKAKLWLCVVMSRDSPPGAGSSRAAGCVSVPPLCAQGLPGGRVGIWGWFLSGHVSHSAVGLKFLGESGKS